MQALPRRGDVDRLVETVGIVAVHGGGDVPRGIERGAVALQNQAGRHIVSRQIDDRGAVVELEKAHIAQFLHLRGHFIGIKTLALVTVEFDAQLLIRLLVLGETDVDKTAPEREVLLVAEFEFVKLGARLVGKRGVGGDALFFVARNGVVDAHVKINEGVDAALFHQLVAAPFFEGHDQFAELRSPVAEVVDAHAVVTEKLVQLFQRVADHGGAEVADMEGLRHVGRGVVKHHGLALSFLGAAVAGAFGKNIGKDGVKEIVT